MNGQGKKIHIFYCASNLAGEELAIHCRNMGKIELKPISLPCSGKLDILYLLKAFETGADGVILAICPEKACSNLEGNLRARKRATAVRELLTEIGLSPDRMLVLEADQAKLPSALQKIEQFLQMIGSGAGLARLPASAQVMSPA